MYRIGADMNSVNYTMKWWKYKENIQMLKSSFGQRLNGKIYFNVNMIHVINTSE